jgi:hypothetical protein
MGAAVETERAGRLNELTQGDRRGAGLLPGWQASAMATDAWRTATELAMRAGQDTAYCGRPASLNTDASVAAGRDVRASAPT